MKQKFLVKFSNFCLFIQVGKLILTSFKYSLRRISIVFTANRYGYVLNMNFENMMATSEPYTAWPKVFSMHVAAPWKRPVFLLVVSKTRKISSLNTTPFFQEHNNSFVLGTSSWIVFFWNAKQFSNFKLWEFTYQNIDSVVNFSTFTLKQIK